MSDVVVIGAGAGGLSSAVTLAQRGLGVTVVDSGRRVGGKIGMAEVDGLRFDTGPSLLTLAEVWRQLMADLGEEADGGLRLRPSGGEFRYIFPDGVVLDLGGGPKACREVIHGVLGPIAAQEFANFMEYSRSIWVAGRDAFVYGPAPTVSGLLQRDISSLWNMRKLDAGRTMWNAICRRVHSPYLRTLFARFATYNGSDVRRAPATLNCIAWVELGLGGYGVCGGMHAIATRLEALARARGVAFRMQTQVRRIVTRRGSVVGVELDDGSILPTRVVVSNADATHLERDLLGRKAPRAEPSMSGYNAVFRVSGGQRLPHTVVFPNRPYMEEFVDLFDRRRPPTQPTVYACDQHRAHGLGSPDAAPVFAMINLPPSSWSAPPQGLAELARARLAAHGVVEDAELLWERDNHGLARRFPGSDGSIYGWASNSATSAFQRPGNRHDVGGLYQASGTAHPGGGVPLCLRSGMTAAHAAMEDMGVELRSAGRVLT